MKFILNSLLFVQIVFAILVGPYLNITDFFPFHQWALFAKVNRIEEVPIIYVSQKDSETFNPPVSYYDLIDRKGPIDFLVAHDNLYVWKDLIDKNLQEDANNVLLATEKQLWPKSTFIKYEIYIAEVDLLDFVKTRQVKNIKVKYGPFTVDKGLK